MIHLETHTWETRWSEDRNRNQTRQVKANQSSSGNILQFNKHTKDTGRICCSFKTFLLGNLCYVFCTFKMTNFIFQFPPSWRTERVIRCAAVDRFLSVGLRSWVRMWRGLGRRCGAVRSAGTERWWYQRRRKTEPGSVWWFGHYSYLLKFKRNIKDHIISILSIKNHPTSGRQTVQSGGRTKFRSVSHLK